MSGQWRKKLKQRQRKKRRQKAAQERDRQLAEEEVKKVKDPTYQHWLQNKASEEEKQRLVEEEEHQLAEEEWLRRELIAQQQFARQRKLQVALEVEQEKLRLEQQKELEEREAVKRKLDEEQKQRALQAASEFEQTLQRMDEYLCTPSMKTPPELRRIIESNPNQKICEFFDRTNCCRFKQCIHNHKRPMLSKILLLHNFYTHPLLEPPDRTEYQGADAALEFSERDFRKDYDDFFDDVTSEMERFGKILNFRTVCNIHAHMRGNVFVEYSEERSALRAFINLQGRYYATKRLNVEFSNITCWRNAICGQSIARRCPKGQRCNYLHILRNPENKYNSHLELKPPSARQTPIAQPNWNDADSSAGDERPRNWRWSESPETEVQSGRHNIHDTSIEKSISGTQRNRALRHENNLNTRHNRSDWDKITYSSNKEQSRSPDRSISKRSTSRPLVTSSPERTRRPRRKHSEKQRDSSSHKRRKTHKHRRSRSRSS